MVHKRISLLNTRGFSLIELVVAVAIAGILLVLGMPTFLSYWRTSTLKAGAQEVVVILNSARQLAIKENQTVCVKGDQTNPSYGTKILYRLGSCTGTVWTGAGTDSTGYMTLSNSMKVQAPGTDVTFTYLGAASPGGTFRVQNPNDNSTASVVVAGSGRVSISYP